MSKFAKAMLGVLVLGACASPIEPKSWDFPDPRGAVINAPVLPHTVWQNPLTLQEPITTLDENRSVYGLVLDGFSDDAVEDRINSAIQAQIDAYLAMTTPLQLPPLRGLYQRVDPQASLAHQQIYANLVYSLNGVVSIMISSQVGFENPDGTMVYFHLSEGLTFECVSGNRLTLSDLMVNSVEITARLNTTMAQVLLEMDASEPPPLDGWFYDAITLVQPFSGLRPTQSFVLTTEGIQVLLDHRTPEFDVATTTLSLTVPYALLIPDLALTVRYADPTAFEHPIKHWQLFQTQDTRLKSEKITLDLQDKTLELRATAPVDLNALLADRYTQQKSLISERLSMALQTIDEPSVDGGVYAYPSGPYTCFNVSYYLYHEVESLSDAWVICYDESGVELTLATMFRDDFDAMAFFRQEIAQELVRTGYYRPGFDLDEALDNLSVSIQLEGLSVSTYAHAPGYSDPEHMYLFLDYTSIGIENLMILHPTP